MPLLINFFSFAVKLQSLKRLLKQPKVKLILLSFALCNPSLKSSELESIPNLKENTPSSAIHYFWNTLEHGHYHKIESCIEQLKSLYLKNPNHSEVALLIAHAHFWRVAERYRLGSMPSPNITDDLIIAERYFLEAKQLNPSDQRINGWLAGVQMSLSKIHDNPKQMRKAYILGKKSIRAYPAFNHFSIAYLFSNHSHEDSLFQRAIDSFYRSINIATHRRTDKVDFDLREYLHLQDTEKNLNIKKAVWNGPKAAHNVEGFFLIMGDFLTKAGKKQEAMVAYKNAQHMPSYASWPYKELLEDRIQNIDTNIERFRITSEAIQHNPNFVNSYTFEPKKSMVFNSNNCTVCHQRYP